MIVLARHRQCGPKSTPCLRVTSLHPPPASPPSRQLWPGQGRPMDCRVASLLAMTREGRWGVAASQSACSHPHRHLGPRAGAQLPLAPRWKKSGAPDQVRGDVGGEWGRSALPRLRACPGTDPSARHCERSEAIHGLREQPITSVVVEAKCGPWIATSPAAPRNDKGGMVGGGRGWICVNRALRRPR